MDEVTARSFPSLKAWSVSFVPSKKLNLKKETKKTEKEKRSLITFLYRGSTAFQVCARPAEQISINTGHNQYFSWTVPG
jgi:hypothetical protein